MYNAITIKTDGQSFKCFLDGKHFPEIKTFDQAQALAWAKGQQTVTLNDFETGVVCSLPAVNLAEKTKLKVQDLTEMNEKMIDRGWADGYYGMSKLISNAHYDKGFEGGLACRTRENKS